MENIFISYSNKDEELFKILKELLETFISHCEFRRKVGVTGMADFTNDGVEKWRETIHKYISESIALIALYTANSSNSPWVHYEIGYAQGCGKNIRVMCTEGVDMGKCIMRENQQIDLSIKIDGGKISTECIQQLLKAIFVTDDFIPLTRFIDNWVKQVPNADMIGKFIYNCNKKDIYIVGSNPYSDEHEQDGQDVQERNVWTKNNGKDVSEFVENMVEILSKENSPFTFSSFPSVPYVGGAVMSKLIAKTNDGGDYKIEDHYRISGLYRMDKETQKLLKDNDIDAATWNRILLNSRLNYLKGKDCMIIIGGSSNTGEEYEASRNIQHLQVFPIPCFGGYGKTCFNQMRKESVKFKKFDHPCSYCKQGQVFHKDCYFIEHVEERLKQYSSPIDKVNPEKIEDEFAN